MTDSFDSRPRRRGLLPAVAAVVVVLAAVGGAYWLGGANNDPPAAAASTSPPPSPSPSRIVVDEEGTCALIIPTGQSIVDQVATLAKQPDGTTVDWNKLRRDADDLDEIKAMSAPDWMPDLDAQSTAVRDLIRSYDAKMNQTISLDGLRSAGLRIAARCAKY